MPVEAIAEFFLRPIFEVILQLIGYFTARILFPLISFGLVTVAPSAKGVNVYPKWHGFNRSSNGNLVLHEEMGALIGILFWFTCIGTCLYVY
ncbi:MAG: hypothetical protein GQ547_06630 [Methylophaga sp.]|nr:hypothetical protein [Methylophaga sp.]